jgi:phage-related tail fiber protein
VHQINVTLANSGVGAGTYRSVTVDAKGRVTAGTNPTTLAGYGITDAASLNSPALSGTPTAPTAAAGTNTTQIATTAFVAAALASIDGGIF